MWVLFNTRNGSDVFRRHDNCRCTVIFQNGSKRQNVHTKKWEDTATNIKPRSEVLKQNEFDALRRQARANGEPYDATEEWLYKAKPNTGKVLEAKSYTTPDGVRYEVDGVNVKLRHSEHEYKVGELIVNTYGGNLIMLPEVTGKFEGVSVADYLYKDERWDLKSINTNGKDTIYNSIHRKKNQSKNFIFEICNDDISEDDAIQQISRLYYRKHSKFVEKTILIKSNRIIKVFEKT